MRDRSIKYEDDERNGEDGGVAADKQMGMKKEKKRKVIRILRKKHFLWSYDK